MAKKIDAQTAALAAAQGSAAVFNAEEEVVIAAQPKAAEIETPVEPAAPTPKVEDVLKMNAMNPMDVKAATAQVKAATAEVQAQVQAMFQPKELVERSTKMAQDGSELVRGNMEAVVASTRIVAQNAGTITQDVAAMGRKNFEGAAEAIKGLAEAKTPAEFVKLQGEFAKSSMETMIADGTRMTETMVKLMGQAMEPVQTRFAANAEKMKSVK